MNQTIRLIANYSIRTSEKSIISQKNDLSTATPAAPAPDVAVTPLPGLLAVANDADPRTLNLHGITRIDLNFPKFTDGRAYSQAFLLRRRLGFQGEIRATGDVLVDQLVQMQRSGFDAAELREDQDAAHAQRQFDRFSAFYQGDAVHAAPHFSRAA
jgi:uncharacterized protein (DUF934 family)